MIRFANIEYNDITNGEGICVSVWFQGCPHRCPGCHNPETWDFNGGLEIDYEVLEKEVLDSIEQNGIKRNLSLLGGEPLCMPNLEYSVKLATAVKDRYPDIKIYCWTGWTLEQILMRYGSSVLENIDVLIDGRFVLEERDITLPLRGSRNQRILYKGKDY